MANYKGYEEAKTPRCECKCGGAFHGKAHKGADWDKFLEDYEKYHNAVWKRFEELKGKIKNETDMREMSQDNERG